jgi:hypothetical protein
MLYEDYATADPEIISKLSLLINRPMSVTTVSSNSSGGLDLRTTRAPEVPPNNSTPAYESSLGGESAHSCQVLNGSCTICSKRLPKKFLALCVNTGRYHKTLGEIDVTNICRDNETFRQIKARYLEVRSFRARARRLFLLRPDKVHFVKVSLSV